MQLSHAIERMQTGMKELLWLHTPAELSSICGVLCLSVKEKASTSVRLIIEHASKTPAGSKSRLDMDQVKEVLDVMWEGALFEYLKTIGHPTHSMFLDPKETVMKIWREGGLMGTGDFIPHFIARKVKKRYEWVASPDIAIKLEKLREMQEHTKKAEKHVLTGHDYTNVLDYFKKMSELRNEENSVREYVVGELEIARSRLDSDKETTRMTREDSTECEDKLISLTGAINDRLGHYENLAETYMNEYTTTESDLQRLYEIMESYLQAEEDRSEAGGGTAQAASLRHADISRQSVRKLHGKMQDYRNMRDENDESLRERARDHITEIDRLQKAVRDLEHKLEYLSRDNRYQIERAEEAERDVKFCAKKMMKLSISKQFAVQTSWNSSFQWQLKYIDAKGRNSDVRKLVVAGLQEKDNTLVQQMCYALNKILKLISPQEMCEIEENVAMSRADAFSLRYRKFLKGSKDKKSKSAKKSVASASGGKGSKKGGSAADDESKASSKASKTTKGKGKKDKKNDKKKKKK